LIERARGGIGAQELHGVGVIDAGAREQAADGVATLHALLAPVGGTRPVGLPERGNRQRTLDVARRNRLERGVRRKTERRNTGQAQHDERQPLSRRRQPARARRHRPAWGGNGLR
jgi:hypothetical protein